MSKKVWYLVPGGIIVIYLLIDYVLIHLPSSYIATYVVQPILWIILTFLVLSLPKQKPAGRSSIKTSLIAAAAMAGILHVVILVVGGFLAGFGRSPYASDPLGIITNIFYVGTALVAIELSRAYLINRFTKRHVTFVVASVAFFITVISINTSTWASVGGGESAITFLGGTWLPLLTKNLLASFLAYLGGPLPAMAYMGILLAFEWFSPLLPDLSPAMIALFGTVAPIVGFTIIQYGLLPYYARIRSRRPVMKKSASALPLGWIATGIFSVVIIWFALGLFSIWPTVIYSGSMNPAIRVGDIVVVSEMNSDDIGVGDVIAYRLAESTTIHRIVDVKTQEGRIEFITQGDANNSPDPEPVQQGQVLGKVVFTIPKIGWAAVGIKNWLFSSG